MDMAIETMRTDEFSMDYFCFGHGERIMVILPGLSIQSVMGSAAAVAKAYASLTDDFTIYLFDRRREIPAVYSIADMAEDTATAFTVLGLEHVCLFGASQGGMIAQELTIRHPELVDRLALGSTCADATEGRTHVIDSWIQLAKARNVSDLYLSFGEALYPKDIFEANLKLLLDLAKTVSEEELNRFITLAESIYTFDTRDRLDAITCQVLILGADDDRVFGPNAADCLIEKLSGKPGFHSHIYNGYGHAAFDLAPDYKARLLAFFAPGAVQ